MNNDIRWKQRFDNFKNAYKTFARTIERYEQNTDDDIIKMALVQAFEFTYELAWKTMKDYLENEGYDEVNNSKQTIRTAFQAGLISNPEEWMAAVEKRNLASHTYNQVILDETVKYINYDFLPLVKKLYEALKELL